ncbi:MAG TPA: GTPase Era [Xanthomonadaceae bacterium]|nr:GTPase Era [Xanthomonadaceae bacterium]
MSDTKPFRAGMIAVLGRPNVGKSTLVNALVGERLSIVSPRPQTTRHRILGIHSTQSAQFVYVDTPGLHRDRSGAMHRYLNRAARNALTGVQAALLVIEAGRWRDEDEDAWKAISDAGVPVLLVVNKVDLVKDKTSLLPFVAEITRERAFEGVFLVEARRGKGLAELESHLVRLLPESAPLYAEDEYTDRSIRFLAAERVREQLMRQLGDELPYATTVEIEKLEEGDLLRIAAVIWVERPGQKGIVIGAGGARLKEIGSRARLDMEKLFGQKVFLQLWCKVREGWSDDEAALRGLGYTD